MKTKFEEEKELMDDIVNKAANYAEYLKEHGDQMPYGIEIMSAFQDNSYIIGVGYTTLAGEKDASWVKIVSGLSSYYYFHALARNMIKNMPLTDNQDKVLLRSFFSYMDDDRFQKRRK